jgi:hypothetical protein
LTIGELVPVVPVVGAWVGCDGVGCVGQAEPQSGAVTLGKATGGSVEFGGTGCLTDGRGKKRVGGTTKLVVGGKTQTGWSVGTTGAVTGSAASGGSVCTEAGGGCTETEDGGAVLGRTAGTGAGGGKAVAPRTLPIARKNVPPGAAVACCIATSPGVMGTPEPVSVTCPLAFTVSPVALVPLPPVRS